MRKAIIRLVRSVKPVLVLTVASSAAISMAPSSSKATPERFPRNDIVIPLGTTRTGPRAADLAPGDTIGRTIDVALVTAGTHHVVFTVGTLAGRSSLLDTDARSGLRMSVTACGDARGWQRQPRRTDYACPTPMTRVLSSTPIAELKGRTMLVPDLLALHSMHLLLSFALPASANNAFEHQSSTLHLVFSTRS